MDQKPEKHLSKPQHEQCPKCGHLIGSHQSVTNSRPPRPGDYTLCGGCLEPLMFTPTGLEPAQLERAPAKIRDALTLQIKVRKTQRGEA